MSTTIAARSGRATIMSRARRSLPIYVAAVVLLLIFCGPIAWMLLQAAREINDTLQYPYDLLPHHWTLQAFSDALRSGDYGNASLSQAAMNSVIYAGISVLTNVALGLPAGYAFARLRFPWRRTLFALVVIAMMVPTAAIIIPLFMVVRIVAIGGGPLGWLNSYQGLIVPTAVTGLSIVLFRQFLRDIPRDLDEAARIDGCNPIGILRHIILPLSGPAIASVATLTFLIRWDDYLWPAVVDITPNMFTLQVALRFLKESYAQQWPLLMASCTLTALPILVVYVVLQPLFDQGLASLGTGWEP